MGPETRGEVEPGVLEPEVLEPRVLDSVLPERAGPGDQASRVLWRPQVPLLSPQRVGHCPLSPSQEKTGRLASQMGGDGAALPDVSREQDPGVPKGWGQADGSERG